MEQSIQRFLEATRQLDSFFIQKRMQVTAARPELTGKEVSNSLAHFYYCLTIIQFLYLFIQCFDSVGWAAGRASRL